MERLFLRVLNMSLTGSYVIVAILLARLLLKRAPKRYSYVLWAAAAFRLICPISFEAVFSLFQPLDLQVSQNAMTSVSPEIGFQRYPQVHLGIPVVSEAVSQALPPANLAGSVNPIQVWIFVGTVLWSVGMAALLVYGIINYVKLRHSMRTATLLEANVYESGDIRSPFILGYVCPRIYIPYGLEEVEKRYVLTHERFHLKHGDHLVKPLAWLVLIMHWFNPLVWLAFHLMGKDMEMRCDEAVLAGEENIRKAYSSTLLSFAAGRRFPSPSPLAFGESGVKTRIKNILKWNKPKLWVTVLAVILCVILIAACAANPVEEKPETEILSEQTASDPEMPVQDGHSSYDHIPIQPVEPEPEPSYYDEPEAQLGLMSAIIGALEAHFGFKEAAAMGYVPQMTFSIIEEMLGCGRAETDDPKEPVGFTTVKMMVMFKTFQIEDHVITETGGAHLPMSLSFTRLQDGTHILESLWAPRDGSDYVEDIKKEFLEENWEAAMDTERYVEHHNRALYLALVNCGAVERSAAIELLREKLEQDPTDITTQRQLRYLGYNPLARGRWMSAEPTTVLGSGVPDGKEVYDKYEFREDGTGVHSIGDLAEQSFTYAYSEDYAQVTLTYTGGPELVFDLEMDGESTCILSNHRSSVTLNWY